MEQNDTEHVSISFLIKKKEKREKKKESNQVLKIFNFNEEIRVDRTRITAGDAPKASNE